MHACVEAGAGLEVRGLRCERGGRPLWGELDFQVAAGSALFVVGPNGSGKTTLLRALAGLTEAHVAHVAWNAAPVALRSALWRTRLAYLGHKPGHKEELSAAENLALACALEGMDTDAVTRLRVLETVGLGGRSALPVKRLSQGQKQRLALARLALSTRPLWLLDEPAAALDDAARSLLGEIVGGHLLRGGVAVVATHDRIGFAGARTTELRLDGSAATSAAARPAAVAGGAEQGGAHGS
jgi:heme exporter protein A